MKTNHELPRDEPDDTLDRAIRAARTQPYPPEVKDRVIDKAIAYTTNCPARKRSIHRWSWGILASTTAVIAVAFALILLLLPSKTVGWEDVLKTINSQPWIHTTYGVPDGRRAEMWLSPQRQVWAFHADNWFLFFDGRRQEKYEYRTTQKKIVKMMLSQEEAQRIMPVDHMSQGSWTFGTENMVSKNPHEVTEAGKKWIEFEVEVARGQYKLGILRVDPATRLPVYMLLRSSSEDAAKSIKFAFDYPADGPADIYALGIPAKVQIDDRMPPADCQQVLREMAASRARIGDFRLVVAVDPPGRGVSSVVWRKGNKWRIDVCQAEGTLPQNKSGAMPPDGLGWGNPFAEELKLRWAGPNLICDGRMVYQNTRDAVTSWYNNPKAKGPPPATWHAAPPNVAPQQLLSGAENDYLPCAEYARIASLVYPDLVPIINSGFEFDPRPADAPGCVLVRNSVPLTNGTVAQVRHYIDPARGCAVVRKEVFDLPPAAPVDPSDAVDRDTYHMEDYEQSPQGFWYPRLIRYENTSKPRGQDQKAGSEARHSEITVHYHFDFRVEIPDSLFDISAAGQKE